MDLSRIRFLPKSTTPARPLAVVQRCAEQHGVRALPVACHMGRWSDVDDFAERVYAEFDHVDVFVNNARRWRNGREYQQPPNGRASGVAVPSAFPIS